MLCFEIGNYEPPTLLFIFSVLLSILGLLQFHVNLEVGVSISTKKAFEILITDYIKYQVICLFKQT